MKHEILSRKDIIQQSEKAMEQFEAIWKANCAYNSQYAQINSFDDIRNGGIGKGVVLFAYGPSLKENLESFKESKLNNNPLVEIGCVDKALKALIKMGIKPRFVVACDARVPESYFEDIDTKDIILIGNVNLNPKWGELWQGKKYYFVNKDNLETEKIFGPLSGCPNELYAASNVSNSLVVFAYQVLRYGCYYLMGYDFSWGDKYYDDENSDKRFKLAHKRMIDINNDFIFTSQNLEFSARWLKHFTVNLNLPIVNCTGHGILDIPMVGKLIKETVKEGSM